MLRSILATIVDYVADVTLDYQATAVEGAAVTVLTTAEGTVRG